MDANQKPSFADRAKTLAAVVFKLGIGLSLLGVVLIGAWLAISYYSEQRELQLQQELVDSVKDVASEYEDDTFNAHVSFKAKYDSDGRLNYQLRFEADEGLKIDSSGNTISVGLLDGEGFLLSSQTISQLSRECTTEADGTPLCTSLSGRGSFPLPVEEYMAIDSISVSHLIEMVQIQKPAQPRRLSQVPRPPTPEPQPLPVPPPPPGFRLVTGFDAELDAWDVKTRAIRIGMTYEEMVEAAGTPRTRATRDLFDTFETDFDTFKYNYGRKWVFFKDRLVASIR